MPRSDARPLPTASCRSLVGSAFKYIGVQPLLDAVVAYLPSPADVPPAKGTDPDTGETVLVRADDAEPFRGLVFKLSTDALGRRQVFVRVYSGRVEPGDTVLNSVTGRRERISRISQVQADREVPVEAAMSGDIVVIAGLKDVITGHTLCSEEAPVFMAPPTFPAPVVTMAIEPKTREDQERLGLALQRTAEDDPTFRYFTDTGNGADDHRRYGRIALGGYSRTNGHPVQGGDELRCASHCL